MKKKLFILLVATAMCFTGCSKEEQLVMLNDNLIAQKEQLNQEIASANNELLKLKAEIVTERINQGKANYVVVLDIRQSHFSLDLSTHIKDSVNAIQIAIPVSETYYNAVSKGQVIDNSFRTGSFFMKGSVGKWKITVDDKYVE